MAVKVIGIFDSMDEAARAREHLIGEGVAQGDIRVGPDEAGEGSVDEHRGGFIAWLKSLFTDDDEYHAATSEAVRRGSCVVAVDAADDAQAECAERVMQACGAVDIDQRAERWRSQEGWQGFDETAPLYTGEALEDERRRNAQHIPVVRESLQVGKRDVMRGGVRVVTRIVDRPVEEQVTLREERAHVERHPVDRPATEAELRGLKEGTIEVTERAEEPVIGKSTRVVEEIDVSKEVSTRTETVRDTVRDTEVKVEQMAARTAPGTAAQQGAAGDAEQTAPRPASPKPKQQR
jgi:stress response protein YsnF